MYTVGVLSEIDDFDSPDDIVDALGAILLESHEEATEEIVNELCGDLFTTLKGYVLCSTRCVPTSIDYFSRWP